MSMLWAFAGPSMSNRSYLCCSPLPGVYPSFADDYDSDVQTLANDVYCIPLLWPALFTPEDFQRADFEVDGEVVIGQAPSAPKQKVLETLRRRRTGVVQAFKGIGDLAPYVNMLERVIEDAPYEYISIEMDEIAALNDPEEEFYEAFKRLLSGLDAPDEDVCEQLIALAAMEHSWPIPSVRLHLDSLEGSEDDYWNHCRVLGAGSDVSGMGRPVPWETA